MRNQYFWPLFGMIWIFGWTFAALLWHHLRSRRAERREERAHRERLVALERGRVETDSEDPAPVSVAPEIPLAYPPSDPAASRRAALAIGMVLVFLGCGIVVAFQISQDPGIHQLWSLGFIPVFPGLALIAYSFLANKVN